MDVQPYGGASLASAVLSVDVCAYWCVFMLKILISACTHTFMHTNSCQERSLHMYSKHSNIRVHACTIIAY